jgi:hypothetical protein
MARRQELLARRHIIPKDRSTNYSIHDKNAVPKQNLPLYQNYDTENSEWMTKLIFAETSAMIHDESYPNTFRATYNAASIPTTRPKHRSKFTRLDPSSRVLSDFDAGADGAPVPVAPLPDEFTAVNVRFRSAT